VTYRISVVNLTNDVGDVVKTFKEAEEIVSKLIESGVPVDEIGIFLLPYFHIDEVTTIDPQR